MQGTHGGTYFPGWPEWESQTPVDLHRLLTNLFTICAGGGANKCEITATRPLHYSQKAHAVLDWVLRWSCVRPDTCIYDDRDAKDQAFKRAQYFWRLLYRVHDVAAAQVGEAEGEQERLKHEKAERQLSYCLIVLEEIRMVQDHVFKLTQLIANSGDPMVRHVVMASESHRNFLHIMKEPGGDGDNDKRSDYEKLLVYLLQKAFQYNYRKSGDVVYEEQQVHIGNKRYGTRAWKPANFHSSRGAPDDSTLEAFVHVFCSKEECYDMWSKLINLKATSAKLVQYLQVCEDVEFPFLRPMRNILSFRNGILDTAAHELGAFYPYPVAAVQLGPDVVAAKFFDAHVETEWFRLAEVDWMDIKTPLFQGILNYQNWGGVPAENQDAQAEPTLAASHAQKLQNSSRSLQDALDNIIDKLHIVAEGDAPALLAEAESKVEVLLQKIASAREECSVQVRNHTPSSNSAMPGNSLPRDVQKWVYIFMGRMLHKLGLFDAWQIIPLIKGRAGTGKSCIAQIIKHFFAPQDIGVLSSNIEKKFGLQSLMNKFAFICFEMKSSLCLDQAEFQSIVSGEEVSIAIKNHAARTIRWEAPGLLCGNEGPGYQDAQGSIARRMALINFRYKVSDKDSDPNLQQNILDQELAALIVKCNIAYRDTADRHQREDIWKILPKYFKEERRGLQRDTDPLYAAIWDDRRYHLVVRDGGDPQEIYIPFTELLEDYKLRWRDIRATQFPDDLSADRYGTAFEDAGLAVFNGRRMWEGQERFDRYISGLGRKSPETGVVV